MALGEFSDDVEAVRAAESVRAIESVVDSMGVDTVSEAKADVYVVKAELLSWLCELELATCAGAASLCSTCSSPSFFQQNFPLMGWPNTIAPALCKSGPFILNVDFQVVE